LDKIAYGGWPNCIRLTNGTIELVATTDVGPRIIRFGFVGQENEFHEAASEIGKTGGDEWRGYGGHRLWHAPESKPRTYFPDNCPVNYEMPGNTLRLIQNTECTTGLQKEMEITLSSDSNHVNIMHKITNMNLWPVEFAPWALTVMRAGGKAIFPQEPYSPHPDIPDYEGQQIDRKYYLPIRNLVMWSYTKFSDPRWVFTDKYVILKQDPKADRPQKLGMSNTRNWTAYARNGHLFVKTAKYQDGATYPDNGCNFETFTNSDMLEVESLGPIVNLAPGDTVTHIEDWYLFDSVRFEETDESLDANVGDRVCSILK
jgi:hypothetical protein